MAVSKISVLFVAMIVFFGSARADDVVASQAFGRTVEASVDRNKEYHYVSLTHENDLLAGSGDKFYTSGVLATYFNVKSRPPEIVKQVADKWLGFDIGKTTLTSFSLGQKIFTPRDIRVSAPQPHDRPWAGWLYGTVAMSNIYESHVDQFGLTLGVVGPASLAEETQTFVHKYISDSPKPRGWNNQLHSEPGLVLQWDRRWPLWREVDLGALAMQVEPSVGLTLGNVYTYATTGMLVTLRPDHGRLQDTPPRLFPAMPGTGYFDAPEAGWDWYLFAGVNGRVMGRNLFLDGNSFRDSPHVTKKPLVGDANAGLALTLGTTRIAYTLVYRTREFDEQAKPSVFGSISLTQRF